MTANSSAMVQELSELRSRVAWLDEERRKYLRRVAELEQQINAQERKRTDADQRVQSLEREVALLKAQSSQYPQVDSKIQVLKDEIVQMIEQYDQRRLAAQDESERRRRVEQEVSARELADVRKELPAIGRLQEAMEQRQAEESRLAQLIGVLQNKTNTFDNRLEEQSREITYTAESEKQNNRALSELQASIHEQARRYESINARIDTVAAAQVRNESNASNTLESQEALRKTVNQWAEQVQLGEYQRNQRLEDWKSVLDEQQDIIEQFRREWVRYSDQYKESQMAVQTMTAWQQHVEEQQREMSETMRVESNRMLTRWDEFLLENEKRWKNSEVDEEQRWAAANRFNKGLQEQIQSLEDGIRALQREKETLWRIQSAQTDVLKALPRIWQEETEKAINQDPNRRRQPTLVPIQDE